ncbi:hypothetical protein FLONG3_5832 [Fusarium longipes]|uniref:Short-chain dehydrogenase n=1 Tax=Fusarium longipes TaxID=694270 RepID=A0A395SRP5_9HYPO|nr:hypothetical protein FLONG3_5832 [Fusarium longipes]
MEHEFLFVDGLHTDKTSKKLMRRHVMKGKNAGKTFHRPSRVVRYHTVERIARPIGTQFFNFPFPVQLTKVASKALHDFFTLTINVVYPTQLGFDIEKYKMRWLEIMFLSKPALIQSSNETYLGAGYSCSNSLSCLSQTLDQLAKRLGGSEALSDHTLSIVMTLINHEQVAGHYVEAGAHVKGMKKIVDLRGGLESIEDGAIASKICRTDILFTLQQGDRPLFHRDRMGEIQNALSSRGFTMESDPQAYQFQPSQLHGVLEQSFSDIMGICNLFNKHVDKKPLDLIEFQEIIISICYRLLQFRTLDESRLKQDVESSYHIALILFIMSIFWNNHQNRLAKPGLIAACIKDALRMAGQLDHEFVFWLLVLDGISVPEKDDLEWTQRYYFIMPSTTHSEFGTHTEGVDVAKAFSDVIRGKTILITGSSQDPHLIIVAGRNPSKAHDSIDALKAEFPNIDYRFLEVDLSSQKSVRSAAEEVLSWSDVPTIDLVINNAAIMGIQERTLNEDGLEMQLATNHVGHWLLTCLIMPKLIKAAEGKPKGSVRIVNITSASPMSSSMRWSDMNFEKLNKDLPQEEQPVYELMKLWGYENPEDVAYIPLNGYDRSKVANVLFGIAANKRLFNKYGILSVAAHPGVIWGTELARHFPQDILDAAKTLGERGFYAFKSLGAGASTGLVAALDPKLAEDVCEGKDNFGSYLAECQISSKATPLAVSDSEAEKLWEFSEKVTGSEFKW